MFQPVGGVGAVQGGWLEWLGGSSPVLPTQEQDRLAR